jgi:hypothetical protein
MFEPSNGWVRALPSFQSAQLAASKSLHSCSLDLRDSVVSEFTVAAMLSAKNVLFELEALSAQFRTFTQPGLLSSFVFSLS